MDPLQVHLDSPSCWGPPGTSSRTTGGPLDHRLKTTALTALMAVNMVLRALHASMYHVALPANQRKNDN